MPRLAREKSESGIYHILLRGSNRQEIFHDEEDYLRFLETLDRFKKEAQLKIYAWCLMNNHIHILLQEGKEDLAITMKRIGVSFVGYYHKKYKTTGHLFQDRYKSEKIENDEYLLTVVRYIHQNPVKASMVRSPSTWKWSSCLGYYNGTSYPKDLLDSQFILGILSKDQETALQQLIAFNETQNEDKCLEETNTVKLKDEEAKAEIRTIIPGINIKEIKNLPKEQRNETIRKIKRIEGVSQRQLARIIGVSQSLISAL